MFVSKRRCESATQAPFCRRLLKRLADSEDVPIGMAHMHLAHVPRLVRRRPGYFKSLCQAVLIDSVHVIYLDRHPDTLVRRFVTLRAEGHLDATFAAPTLTVFA